MAQNENRMHGSVLALALFALQDPVTTAWLVSPRAATSAPELRKVLPEVHSVTVREREVEVHSAGLSMTYLGPFQSPLTGDGGVRDLVFRIPRFPQASNHTERTGPGVVGVFVNGIPLYNRFAGASYLGQNMWHFDTVAAADKDPGHPLNLGALQGVVADSGTRHSPLLGFALDGFPIYGPWGLSPQGKVARAHSGYRLRSITDRTSWPDGTQLTPGQYGPAVNSTFPLGTFVEDYEYAPEPGDLDEANGRFAVTPEYPKGTYAYFLTTSGTGALAFPYFIGERYHGTVPGAAPITGLGNVRFAQRGDRLSFSFHNSGGAPVRSLEIVHERPLHLMVVSEDLEEFDHIHPEWTQGDVYEVAHVFRKPGRHRLFAQFTLPGEAEQVAAFDVDVKTGSGKPPAPPSWSVELVKPAAEIRAGQDLTFEVKLPVGAQIEPYLGAWAHFVWIDQGLGQFIHAHPFENAVSAADPARPHIHGVSDVASGPPPRSVRFATNFAGAGKYKLWAQFQVGGSPVVFPFVVDVAPALAVVSRETTPIPNDAINLRVDERGFTPERVEARQGGATLAVERAKSPNCGSKIVFPSLGITRDLPLGETTLITLPEWKGSLSFTCGMGMYRGVIVATGGR